MADPLVSIVIPTRDTRDLTLTALGSLQAQARERAEIILVDDGSSDDTLQAAGELFPEVRQIRTAGGIGFARAVNAGVAESTADLIWLLNSDTEAAPDCIDRLTAHFDRDPRVGIGGAQLSYPDGTPQWSGGRFPNWFWLVAQASGLPPLLGRLRPWRSVKPTSGTTPGAVDWVPGAAMAVRREVWNLVGPLRTEYRCYCQDLDLCWRARQHGWGVSVMRDVHVSHELGGTIGLHHRAVGSVRPGQLWSDLVRFFSINHGHQAARHARRAIWIGARARVMCRRMATPFTTRSGQPAWRAETDLYATAVENLERIAPEQ